MNFPPCPKSMEQGGKFFMLLICFILICGSHFICHKKAVKFKGLSGFIAVLILLFYSYI